jgi:hypothetical protein
MNEEIPLHKEIPYRYEDDWWWLEETTDMRYDELSHTLIAKTPKGKLWKRKVEPTARDYELARRHDRALNLPPFPMAGCFPFLLEDITTPDNLKIYRNQDFPIGEDIEVWDDHNYGPMPVDWNYAGSVDRAIEEFRRMFLEEKIARGITRKGLSGIRNRPLSWRWPELMDEALFIKTPRFKPNERSQLSKARKSAKMFHSRLMAEAVASGWQISDSSVTI